MHRIHDTGALEQIIDVLGDVDDPARISPLPCRDRGMGEVRRSPPQLDAPMVIELMHERMIGAPCVVIRDIARIVPVPQTIAIAESGDPRFSADPRTRKPRDAASALPPERWIGTLCYPGNRSSETAHRERPSNGVPKHETRRSRDAVRT